MLSEIQQMLSGRFKIICCKCGSDDVVIDFDPGHVYSEHTQDPPTFSAGCNACKDNDIFHFIY